MSGEALMATQGIPKRFGGVIAVEDVDFGLGHGESSAWLATTERANLL